MFQKRGRSCFRRGGGVVSGEGEELFRGVVSGEGEELFRGVVSGEGEELFQVRGKALHTLIEIDMRSLHATHT